MILLWKTIGMDAPSFSSPAIPHNFSMHERPGFPIMMGCPDTAAAGGRRGSNVYEVNPWLWQFGRGKPRLGDLTVGRRLT